MQAGSFYTLDSYTVYDGVPYISLADHTGSAAFNDDLNDYWKRLVSWPRVNQVTANGYNETLPDQIRTHNYGDVLYSLDDIAQLLIGYQDYLNAVGWSFTDINELGENVDFENLLIKGTLKNVLNSNIFFFLLNEFLQCYQLDVILLE